jgi:hypothetical protein
MENAWETSDADISTARSNHDAMSLHAGELMPMIAASLLAWSGGSLAWVLAYFVLICGLAVGAVISAHETAKAVLERLT